MKSSSTAIAVLLCLSGAVPAGAESVRLAQTFAADIVPPYEVFTIIRSMGMRPLGRPHYRGRFYVVYAVDRRGEDVRVTVDARAARVVSVQPLDRQPASEYDGPSVYRRYDSGPPPVSGPRVIEAEPRYVPPRAVPGDPRYGVPQTWPDEDDYPGDGPDEFDADDERETGSLPPRDVQRPVVGARPSSAVSAPLTRRAAVTPPKMPLPRPRPEQLAKADEPSVAAASPAGTKVDDGKAGNPEQDAAKSQPEAPESQKSEVQNPDAASYETPKPAVRIIEIKKPEPRI